jgi:DNA polymerase I-like protein with 3'-5' exonuclease and polymerase domains
MLQKKVVPKSKIAVVEIRQNSSSSGFDKRAMQLLGGSFQEAGIDFQDISRYSLTSTSAVRAADKQELIAQLRRGKYEVVLAVGAEAMHTLCETKKVLDKYAGSLTWSGSIGAWVLPSYHPSVVYVGDKKTLNARYDKFDLLFDHVHRVAKLSRSDLPFPDKSGYTSPTRWIGHDGQLIDGRWHGYYEVNPAEAAEAEALFTGWLDLLDYSRTRIDQPPLQFAIDTESRNTDVRRDHGFLMLQVYDGDTAYAINAGVLHHPQVEPLVKLFLMHGQARFCLWNTKYDRQVIWHEFGVDLEDRDVDGMVLSMGITEKGRQCGLKYRSRQDLNAPFYEEALDEWINKDDVDYSCIPPHVLAEYGCKDVYYTFHEIPLLLKQVREEGTLKLCTDLLMPAQRVLADVEYQGMGVDIEYARATSAAWEPKINDAIRKVQDYARDVGFPTVDSGIGRSYKSVCECVPVRAQFHLEGARVLSYAKLLREAGFDLPACVSCGNKRYVSRLDITLNVNSSTQMQHLCFDILGMKELPYEARSTQKEFWKLNANHPLAKMVAEYKELQYLRRNFLEGVQRFVAEDGRVHPDFLLFGTKTGRLAIHDPAMQTVPQHGENAKAAKKLFVADEGCYIVNVDYKSLEMFIAHHLTGDPVLLENLLGEWDVHTALAAKVYGKNPADVTPEERQSVKSVNFGAGYGISGFKLSLDPAMEQATGGDPEVAQQFIDAFWNMYSVWAAKCDEWRAQAHDQQYITTEMGRKRRWNLITKDNYNKVNNQAINFSGQSMASDLCLSSLVRLHRELQDRGWGRVLLTVHDSLVFNVRRENVHEAVELIVREMTTPPFKSDTPFAVDVEVGLNYGEKEKYDPEKVYA